MADTRTHRDASQRADARLVWLVVALLAVALVPFVQELTAQPAIRQAQTAAMVDHHDIRLDAYRKVVGVDKVERGGHLYGDKAPLQPLLAMPAYAAARLGGAEPATVLRVHGNLTLWSVTVWSTVLPLLAIAALGVRLCLRLFDRRRAVLGTLATCGGTLLLAYGTQLYAHVLAGLLGWACWLLVSRSAPTERTWWHALLGGALGGAAVATEYPLAIVVVVVAVVLASQRAWRHLAAFVAGGVPFACLLAGYQWLAYGNPFTVSYTEKPEHAADPLVLRVPSPLRLAEVLFGSRGLLLFSPVVALAIWGLVRLARSAGGPGRLHGRVGLAVVGLFLVLQASWQNPWGGEAPGPRYVIPALPFLIVGMAEVWDAAGRTRWLAIRWSVVAMSLPVVAMHLVAKGNYTAIAHLQTLRSDGPVVTLWTMAVGPSGWVLHLASIGAVGAALAAALRRVPDVVPAAAERQDEVGATVDRSAALATPGA